MSKKTQTAKPIMKRTGNERIDSGERACRDQLGVSTETVRRDLSELDSTGQIKRTYGGAVRTKTFEPALAERSNAAHRRARKDRPDGGRAMWAMRTVYFIGGGATTLHLRTRPASNQATDDGANSLHLALPSSSQLIPRLRSWPCPVLSNRKGRGSLRW